MTIDVEDLSVFSNIERPALWELPPLVNDTIGFRDFFSRITQNGIVDTQRFSESLVLFRRVSAGGEVGDVGLPEGFAILTE